MKLLVVVDMQNDFVDGALGTAEAQAIIPNVVSRIKEFKNNGDKVVATLDTHDDNYLKSQEGQKLPIVHCIKDTHGWCINSDVEDALKGDGNEIDVITKDTFGSVRLAKYVLANKDKFESVTLIGLCTSLCVISNASLIKSFVPEMPIVVDSSSCACITPESNYNGLEALKTLQVEVL